MASSFKSINKFTLEERKELLSQFFNKVIFPQRRRLIDFRTVTNQSAQVDSDGHIAQLVASIVTGIPGTGRHGKTGSHLGDLSDGTEVKSTYKCEQKNDKEDAHINFGGMATDKMEEFLSHKRCIIVHTYYDIFDRFKTEILDLNLNSAQFQKQFKRLQDSSEAKNPQFQPRLYPDGVRDRLNETESSFKKFGAKVLARVVETREGALVDLWRPEKGLPTENVLSVSNKKSIPKPVIFKHKPLKKMTLNERQKFARYFFQESFLNFRKSFLPFCKITNTTQNLGFANLSQHLVSIITGLLGANSNARGPDLEDGSDIKQALGMRGDDLGTEDIPRLDLLNNVKKMLTWPDLYASRIECSNNKLKIKILKADIQEFRKQVKDYFGPNSKYKNSKNMQYHPKKFSEDLFTGEDSKRNKRILHFERLIALQDNGFGKAIFI